MSIKSRIYERLRFINKYREKRYLKSLRKRNRNVNPTIVCNNCVAGVIYHNLGLRFNSPTINLFIKGAEYLEFVKHFKYYSKCELEEVSDSSVAYPIGRLMPKDTSHKEIHIHFQHYRSFAEAKDKWFERYSRVNWDNTFFIWEFYDSLYPAQNMYDFDNLDVDNKILLTHKKFDNLKNSFALSCYKNDQPVAKILEYKALSGKRYLEEFDYVAFLNRNIT